MSDEGEIKGHLRLDAGDFLAKIEEAKGQLEELTAIDPRVNVEAVVREALLELARAQSAVDRLRGSSPSVRVHADTAAAIRFLQQVQRQADELGGRSPEVRVDADTTRAEEILDAFRAAIDQLSTRSPQVRVDLDDAAAQAALAALTAQLEQLAAMRPQVRVDTDIAGALEQLDLLTARVEALARMSPTIRVDIDTAGAEARIAALQAQLAGLRGEASGVGTASAEAGSGVGVLVAAILALGPALVPISAAAVGYTAAVGMLGAAGVLAFLGVKDAIKANSTEGRAFGTALGVLKGDLDDLASTAASGVLTGFERSVRDVQSAMPNLNQQVGFFATELGDITAVGLEGILGALRVMQPLLQTAGVLLTEDVAALAQFGRSTEFQGFVAYAAAELPQVNALLTSLVTNAGHILIAFAPFGQVVLNVLQGVSGAINAIPIPVLTMLAGAAAAVAVGFLAWKAAAAGIVAVQAAIEALSGPIGWVALGLGALVAVVGAFAPAAREATVAADDYFAALQQDNGAIGEAVTKHAALNLQQQGLYQTGLKLGISQETLTAAVLGNKDAQDQVSGAVTRANEALKQQALQGGQALASSQDQRQALGEFVAKIRDQESALKSSSTAYQNYTAAVSGGGSGMSTAAQAAQVLAGNLNMVYTATLALETTSDNATIAIDSMGSALRASAKHAKDHAASLNQDTAAGAQNRLAVSSAVDGILKHSAAMNADGKHTAEATAYTEGMIGKLAAQAVAAGASRTKVAALVAELTGMPKSQVTTLLAIDQATPKAKSAAESANNFSTKKYAAVLEANKVPADAAIKAAEAAAKQWGAQHPKATIDGNPQPAEEAAADAAKAARAYALGHYSAKVNADPSGAISGARTAQGAIDAVHGKTVTITTQFATKGSKNDSGITPGAHAYGGTIGAAANAVLSSAPRHAYGATVAGPGSFSSDSVLSWLSRGEEVVSNIVGQADRNRPMLKAINTGNSDLIRRTAADQYGGGCTDVQVYVSPKLPGYTVEELVDLRIVKAMREQSAANLRTVNAGWRQKGLLSGVPVA